VDGNESHNRLKNCTIASNKLGDEDEEDGDEDEADEDEADEDEDEAAISSFQVLYLTT